MPSSRPTLPLQDTDTFSLVMEAELVAAARSALREGTGLDTLVHETQDGSVPDGFLELRGPGLATPAPFAYLVKHRIRTRNDLQLAVATLGSASPLRPLLITTHLTAGQLQWCRQIGLACLDTAGNAHLEAPGCYVHVSGQAPRKAAQIALAAPESLVSAAGLRVLFVLLTHHSRQPGRISLTFRDLAEAAGVSLGTVSRIASALEDQGYAIKQGGSLQRLLNVSQLADLWLGNYPLKLRPKLRPTRFSGVAGPHWWETFDPAPYEAQWSGETAHALLTHELRPQTQTLYVASAQRARLQSDLMRALRLRPDPQGTVEILDCFWRPPLPDGPAQAPACAPLLLVCADMMPIADARVREAANGLLAKVRHEG